MGVMIGAVSEPRSGIVGRPEDDPSCMPPPPPPPVSGDKESSLDRLLVKLLGDISPDIPDGVSPPPPPLGPSGPGLLVKVVLD